MIIPLTQECFTHAAQAYAIPQESLYVIASKLEGGWEGLAKPNVRKDGKVSSYDLGRFQVNTAWVPTFTTYWKSVNWVPKEAQNSDTYALLRDDGCANAHAAAAIVRYYWLMTGNLNYAIAYYHTGPKGSVQEMSKYLWRYRDAMIAGGYWKTDR